MTAQQATMGEIELSYTLTDDDLAEGIAAQRRGIRRGWWAALLMVPALVGLAIGLVRSAVWEAPADAAPQTAIACVAAVLLAVGVGLLTRRLLVRRIHRWQARLLMRGNPTLARPIRTTVSSVGISVDNATGASMSSWSMFPLYVEGDHVFVLVASEGPGATALVLPRRALPDDDTARLRAVLDTYSHRRP
ncbi:YcxB family protein [Asanoa sp. NPDC050611]|uniref:YcxB family protein n=1 Tax=Asanoa sp. NPDC050611 TaxID=3157098 RepID=UPI0033E1A5A5